MHWLPGLRNIPDNIITHACTGGMTLHGTHCTCDCCYREIISKLRCKMVIKHYIVFFLLDWHVSRFHTGMRILILVVADDRCAVSKFWVLHFGCTWRIYYEYKYNWTFLGPEFYTYTYNNYYQRYFHNLRTFKMIAVTVNFPANIAGIWQFGWLLDKHDSKLSCRMWIYYLADRHVSKLSYKHCRDMAIWLITWQARQ